MIKTGYFLIKQITQTKYYQFCFSQLHYVGTHVVMTAWAFGGHCMQKKHLISSWCYKSVKLTFSATPPSRKALLRSPWQAVTMTTSENGIFIWLENILEPSNQSPQRVQRKCTILIWAHWLRLCSLPALIKHVQWVHHGANKPRGTRHRSDNGRKKNKQFYICRWHHLISRN